MLSIRSKGRLSWRPLSFRMSPVGTFRTWRDVRLESAFGGRADVICSPTTDRSRAGIALTAAQARLLVRHNHWRARPNQPRASHGSKTSPHAYVGEQMLAGGALHSGNTFW